MATSTESIALDEKALYENALEKMRRRRFPEACDDLQRALEKSPENPDYLSHYGLCLAHSRHGFEAAMQLCSRALKLRPHDPVLQVNLGRVYKLQGDNGSAYRAFLHAFHEDRRSAAAASELTRMGVRRPPVLPFLGRSHWCNRLLGKVRTAVVRSFLPPLRD